MGLYIWILGAVLMSVFYISPLLHLVNFKFGWLRLNGLLIVTIIVGSAIPSISVTEFALMLVSILVVYILYTKSAPFELKDNIYHFNFKNFYFNVIYWMMIIKLGSSFSTAFIIKCLNLIGISDGTRQQTVQDISVADSFWTLVMLFISVTIIAPITEEYTIRYILYGYILKTKFKLHSIIAAIISSLVFAMMHDSLTGIVNAFCMGLGLAWIYNKYGLWYSIVAHSLFNLLSFIIIRLI